MVNLCRKHPDARIPSFESIPGKSWHFRVSADFLVETGGRFGVCVRVFFEGNKKWFKGLQGHGFLWCYISFCLKIFKELAYFCPVLTHTNPLAQTCFSSFELHFSHQTKIKVSCVRSLLRLSKNPEDLRHWNGFKFPSVGVPKAVPSLCSWDFHWFTWFHILSASDVFCSSKSSWLVNLPPCEVPPWEIKP